MVSDEDIEKMKTLVLVIQEEVGELQQAMNLLFFEDISDEEKKYLNNAFSELQDIFAPLIELHELLRKLRSAFS